MISSLQIRDVQLPLRGRLRGGAKDLQVHAQLPPNRNKVCDTQRRSLLSCLLLCKAILFLQRVPADMHGEEAQVHDGDPPQDREIQQGENDDARFRKGEKPAPRHGKSVR